MSGLASAYSPMPGIQVVWDIVRLVDNTHVSGPLCYLRSLFVSHRPCPDSNVTESVVTRTCGKHIAIQSEDTPPGRSCEQCIVSSLHGGVEHCQPYIWNNSNYLLKMTDDLDFLKSVHPLVSWLGNDFKFQDNPFLLASEYVHQYSEVRTVKAGKGRGVVGDVKTLFYIIPCQ